MNMENTFCPNCKMCRLVTSEEFPIDKDSKEEFLKIYCESVSENWLQCMRYVTKHNLGFCPEFVLPDTIMTLDEVMDKFDEVESNN